MRASGPIAAGDSRALAQLIAEIAACGDDALVPLTTFLLSLSQLAPSFLDALFADRPGMLLIQDYLAIKVVGPITPQVAMHASSSSSGSLDQTGSMTLSVDFSEIDGSPLAAVKAGLRLVDSDSLARSQCMDWSRAAKGTAAYCCTSRPITAEMVRRYVTLAGDGNPIHVDPMFATSRGLPGPVIPGALVAAVMEPIVATHLSGVTLGMSVRLIAPVQIGSSLDFRLEVRPEGAFRVLCGPSAGGVAAICDGIRAQASAFT